LTEHEQLPKGSAWSLETILMLAREIQEAESLEEAKMKAGVIAQEAGELVERYNRQIQIAA
jgi:hypothetical protein